MARTKVWLCIDHFQFRKFGSEVGVRCPSVADLEAISILKVVEQINSMAPTFQKVGPQTCRSITLEYEDMIR